MKSVSSILVSILLLLSSGGCVREIRIYCETPPCPPPIKEKVAFSTFLIDAIGAILTFHWDEFLEQYKLENQLNWQNSWNNEIE